MVDATGNATGATAQDGAGTSQATGSAKFSPDSFRARMSELGHDVEGPTAIDDEAMTSDVGIMQAEDGEHDAQQADAAEQQKPDEDHEVDPKTGEKKLGRIGKLKEKFRAQVAERETKIASLVEEQGKWREASTKVLAQNRAMLERLQWLESVIEQSGVQIDPRDREIFELRQQRELEGFTQQVSQRSVEQRAQAEQQAKVQTLASQMREQAESVAEAHGLELPALVKAWHAVSEAQGQTVSLDEVAQMLAISQRQRQEAPTRAAVARQAHRNSTAPRTTNTSNGAPSGVKWSRTQDGIAAFLASQGHEIR